MARIRSLKPEIWMSPQVMNLQHDARLLFIGLITQADDEGRGTADHRRLKAAIFGGDDITSADVQRMLGECIAQGLAVIYETETHGLIYALPGWGSHQSIDRPRKSSYPAPPARSGLAERSPKPREGSEGSEGKDLGRIGRIVSPRAREPGQEFSDGELMDAFAVVRSTYPAFSGRQDWPNAEHHWRMRIEQGKTPAELMAGVERYAAFVAAGGVSGIGFVMAPGKFFSGADQPWAQPWTPPTSKAEARQDANIAAGKEWLAGGGNG